MELSSPSLLQRRKQNFASLSTSIQQISVKPRTSRRSLPMLQQSTPSPFEGGEKNSHPKTLQLIEVEEQQHQRQGSAQIETVRTINSIENAFEESFETGDKIGQGAHGVVRRCIHRETGRQFAVKVMQMEDEHFRFLKTNFINMKQLKSDHIIKYKALFLNTKTRLCHLVMEYLPHPSLKPPLPETTLRYVFYKVLDGLTYIHQKHLCHRDIKPDNIVFDKTSGIVKIVDFGVSKNMNLRGRYELMLTNTGTLAYKAPEMFEGAGYSQRVDAWAVGVSLYQMVTGKTPFQAEYIKDTIERIQNDEPDLEHPAFDNFSHLLKDLLGRLLKKNPKQRMRCKEAKQHLWFNPHLHDIDFMKSAGIPFKFKYQDDDGSSGVLPYRRVSLSHEPEESETPTLSQGDKLLMKGWLSELGKNGTPEQEYKYDMVESDSEEGSAERVIPGSNYMSMSVIPHNEENSPVRKKK